MSDLKKAQLAQAAALDARAAAAVRKFEVDLFAKLRAQEKTALGAQAWQNMLRDEALKEGLNRLPMGDFDRPQYWNSPPK
jgi:hypothetical protein